jgi:hypothetical protein
LICGFLSPWAGLLKGNARGGAISSASAPMWGHPNRFTMALTGICYSQSLFCGFPASNFFRVFQQYPESRLPSSEAFERRPLPGVETFLGPRRASETLHITRRKLASPIETADIGDNVCDFAMRQDEVRPFRMRIRGRFGQAYSPLPKSVRDDQNRLRSSALSPRNKGKCRSRAE